MASYDEVFQDRSVNITLIMVFLGKRKESRNFSLFELFLICVPLITRGCVAINQNVAI